MSRATADLCDEYGNEVRVLEPRFISVGGVLSFAGPVTTVRVREDNALVRAVLESPGQGRVLVVDGGASVRCALVGGKLGRLAETNGWAGIVVWGAVRDVAELQACLVGIRALASNPRPPAKTGAGDRDVAVQVAGVTVHPGEWLCADADGVIISRQALG
jgi:regulator of ribonuclease activity A